METLSAYCLVETNVRNKMLWCTCRRAVDVREGYVARPVDNPLWVHSVCGKPARMVFENLTHNRAPRGATALVSYFARKDGMHELRYAVGSEFKIILSVVPYDRRPFTMGVNPNDILLKTWEMLDDAIKSIKETTSAMDMTYQKARARALCDTLALMMPPFFHTADEIGHEALRRYENRDNPEYETPGLGQKSLAEHDNMPYAHSKPITTTKPEVVLDDKTRAGIKMALESGMFTVAQLSKSYNVSAETIESCR